MPSIKKFIFIFILKFIKNHLNNIILKIFCSKKILFKKNKQEIQRLAKLNKLIIKTPYKPKYDKNINEKKTVKKKKMKKMKKNGTSQFINVIVFLLMKLNYIN